MKPYQKYTLRAFLIGEASLLVFLVLSVTIFKLTGIDITLNLETIGQMLYNMYIGMWFIHIFIIVIALWVGLDKSVLEKKTPKRPKTTLSEKEQLIQQVINDGSEQLAKTRDEHAEQLADYRKNGFDKEIHPDNIESIKTGLHYTHGYAIGHFCLLEKVNNLMEMSIDEIKELIAENKRISAENEKRMNDILNNIKSKNKDEEETK